MDSTNEPRYDIKKNFGMTPEEFNLHLNNLKKGDEMLFEIVFKEHFERCRTFLIRKLDADSDVAYDITLETLIKFRKNLIADKIKYGNLAALFTIDARNNFLRLSQKESKYEHVSAESQEDTIPEEPALNNLDLDLVDKLKILGYQAYLDETVSTKGAVFKVKVGRFSQRQQAAQIEKDLSRKGYPTKLLP